MSRNTQCYILLDIFQFQDMEKRFSGILHYRNVHYWKILESVLYHQIILESKYNKSSRFYAVKTRYVFL